MLVTLFLGSGSDKLHLAADGRARVGAFDPAVDVRRLCGATSRPDAAGDHRGPSAEPVRTFSPDYARPPRRTVNHVTTARPARAPQAGLPGESHQAPISRSDAAPRRYVESMPVIQAAVLPTDDVLRTLGSDGRGLTEDEVLRRRAAVGPNAVRSHHARPWAVLGRQLASPLLVLLLVTALVSFVVGERTDAVIIGVILAASVGLGFVNEYRAERTAEALHSAVHHLVVVAREGAPRQVDVTELVPGDVVRLALGAVVPADLRLMAVTGLECNESVLTGESAATTKRVAPVAEGTVLAELDRSR